jgi:hypothetical protein
MGVNSKDSNADPICPTYAAGTCSLITAKGSASGEFNDDCARKGQPNGYYNSVASTTVGSFNNDWQNGCWSQNVVPTYSSCLLRFGIEGRQS